MTPRRIHLALLLGALASPPTLLLVRQSAVAQRHRRAEDAAPPGGQVAGARPSGGHGTSRPPAVPPTIRATVEGLDPSRARRERGRYVAELPDGRRAVLTLDPTWQRAIARLIEGHQIPRASVVVLDTDTGRVRAYASRAEPGAGDLAREAEPPAASVFKIVTSSALLAHGLSENASTCYSGGFHALRERDLEPDPSRDRDCLSLADAFGHSANTIFARRALERLTPAGLLAQAHAWGFGETVPFDAPVAPGAVDVPESRLEFARAAAGFWHSHLSPVHGAVIAQAIARGGEMLRPFIVEALYDAQGVQVGVGAPQTWRRAVSPEVAAALARMMTHSVSMGGTAYHAFHDPAGLPFLPGVDVGGKTGTLTGTNPYRAYTWFVGNASGSGTRVSFAVMVANGPVWRVRAATLARQVLQIIYRGRATN